MNALPVVPAVTEYLYRKATAAGIPLSGTFELTPVCNMDCKMCYVRMSRAAQEAVAPLKGADRWLALAREAKDAGMLYLLVTGGEPFLHPPDPADPGGSASNGPVDLDQFQRHLDRRNGGRLAEKLPPGADQCQLVRRV